MFSNFRGYSRLPFVGSTTEHGDSEMSEYGIPRYGSEAQRPQRQLSKWTQRRIVRWGIVFVLSWAIIATISLSTRREVTIVVPEVVPEAPPVEEVIPEKPKGEFDDCPELLGPQPGGNRDDQWNENADEDRRDWSEVILPSTLLDMMDRGKSVPRNIIHQSWKNRDKLPKHFTKWSHDWRRIHGRDWIYVLWTDDDNRRLARDYYPEFLEAYNGMSREIFRADMVRNMYMHRFGGIYADLDLAPLSPLHVHLPDLLYPDEDEPPRAYVGQMGGIEWSHSIPNAFMATTLPGHPFWIKPLEYVRKHWNDTSYNSGPEGLTGPVALRNCTLEWLAAEEEGNTKALYNKVQVLADRKIYPLNWAGAEPLNWCLCRLHSSWFNANNCNDLYPQSWTITYWTHSWS